MTTEITLFENAKIRREFNKVDKQWYFSIVDIIEAVTDSQDARTYWKVLKNRLLKEGNQTVTNCNQLKMVSKDGRMRETDVFNTEQVFRILQSVPSPKVEPFKNWLAQIASDRLKEINNPELAISRAIDYFKQKGYDNKWINERIKTLKGRSELTDEWEKRGVKENEFGILTNTIYEGWAGMSAKEYKEFKNIKSNLRDNMTPIELALNSLAEITTTEISKQVEPKTFDENKQVAIDGSKIAGDARKQIELKLGKSVISKSNANELTSKPTPQLPE